MSEMMQKKGKKKKDVLTKSTIERLKQTISKDRVLA